MGFTDDKIKKGSICLWQVKQSFVFPAKQPYRIPALHCDKLNLDSDLLSNVHILITQASFNIFHEIDPHAFYNHYPPLNGQRRPSVWNNGAKRGAGELGSLSSCCASVTNDTLLESQCLLSTLLT